MRDAHGLQGQQGLPFVALPMLAGVVAASHGVKLVVEHDQSAEHTAMRGANLQLRTTQPHTDEHLLTAQCWDLSACACLAASQV